MIGCFLLNTPSNGFVWHQCSAEYLVSIYNMHTKMHTLIFGMLYKTFKKNTYISVQWWTRCIRLTDYVGCVLDQSSRACKDHCAALLSVFVTDTTTDRNCIPLNKLCKQYHAVVLTSSQVAAEGQLVYIHSVLIQVCTIHQTWTPTDGCKT